MGDSVHSLSSPFRGYFEWKQDHRQKEERKNSTTSNFTHKDTLQEQAEYRQEQILENIEDDFGQRLIDDSMRDNRVNGSRDAPDKGGLGGIQISKSLPEKVLCPNCRKSRLTVVDRERSSLQICYTILLCLLILVGWPCACLVWYSTNMMDYHHSCSNCDERISTFNPHKARK